jgi:putative SOS response-associated peptidase YedK
MCTRYVFTDPAEAIRDLFRVTGPLPNWPPNYNVAPTNSLPVAFNGISPSISCV